MVRDVYETDEFFAMIDGWVDKLPPEFMEDPETTRKQAIIAWLILIPVAGTA